MRITITFRAGELESKRSQEILSTISILQRKIMLDINEAQSLMETLIALRTKAQETQNKKDILQFKKQQQLCVEKFSYLITMKTAKYRAFSNYDDLNQEGFEALLKGMKNYDPKKGNAFWWFHRYIDTRIARSANLHTTIRYPLKVAKKDIPHKEFVMPHLIEEQYCPDKELESAQSLTNLDQAFSALDDTQQKIIDLAYGLTGDKPMSVNKICKKLSISRSLCLKTIDSALSVMKSNIKV